MTSHPLLYPLVTDAEPIGYAWQGYASVLAFAAAEPPATVMDWYLRLPYRHKDRRASPQSLQLCFFHPETDQPVVEVLCVDGYDEEAREDLVSYMAPSCLSRLAEARPVALGVLFIRST